MTIQTNSPVPARLMRRLAALLVAAAFSPLQAAPVAPKVVSGQATFVQQGNVFSITNTPNTVINWQSFNVNPGEVTRFIQQSSDSAVLNRILGQDPSQILGALQSNGHVFLINPNGILFGRDARIDVNGLTASTLGMSNNEFLAGRNNFAAGASAGALLNQGSIATPSGGKVFLIAPSVTNNGVITSPQGQVVLAAGHTVQLVDSANPDLHVVVAAPANQAINLGQIIAQGGKVGIYGALVNQRGIINANSAQLGANGKIVLRASGDAMLEAGSVTSATGVGNGGQVSVAGTRVGMTGDASIDVSGATGGGTVLLGGGYQGKNALVRNAHDTLFGKNATILADATASGNGGTVVLWGDASTRAAGRISARGGLAWGQGGLVETSGKYLDVKGLAVNAAARNGANGTWLLDPYDIDVLADGLAQLGDVDEFADPGAHSILDPVTLNSVAPGTNVVLQATHDVMFSSPINAALGTGSLTVEAGNSILINSAIATGGGAIKLTANHPGGPASGSGLIAVGTGGTIDTGGGSLTMNGTQLNLDGALVTRNGDITLNGGNLVSFGQNVVTGVGALSVIANSIVFGGSGTAVDTGTGAMNFYATGGTFTLGSGWKLSSGSNIGVTADSMLLQGTIGGSLGQRPMVNFNTFSPGQDIDFSVGRVGGALQLDPAWLATLDASWLMIGAPSHTGTIHVYNEYGKGLADRLTFNNSGDMWIYKPLMMPAGTGSSLELLLSGTNNIAAINTAPDVQSVNLIPGGQLTGDNVVVRANNMSIGASITGTGTNGGNVQLTPHMPTAQIHIGGGAVDSVNQLGLDSSELAQIHTRMLQIGGIPGQSGAMSIMAPGADFSSNMTSSSLLLLNAGVGELRFDGSLVTPGGLLLQGSRIGTGPGARVTAGGIRISSTLGIGADAAPFYTQTNYLAASNTAVNGVEPINISNNGSLELGSIHQNGIGNQGSISISNAGAMVLPALEKGGGLPVSVFTGGSGNIQLKTMSPLTIDGEIKNDFGMIALEAGNGGLLTIGATGKVSSNGGNIGLVAGDVVNNGGILTMTGNITVAANTVTGSGTYSAPGGSITGLPVVPPTIPDCLANTALPGCAAVLKAALDACVVNPNGTYCSALLPSLTACIADPGMYGCSAVLPTLAACIANPSTPGCTAVLPTLTACIANPSTPGCTAVLPTLTACIANPSTPGCTAVLPTVAACIANPSTPGCTAVLPTLTACIANPSTPGCTAVLPTLAACIANPSTPGCIAVLPTLTACIANPSTPGCSVVLPTLAVCIADPGKQGCSAVLPTLTACIANPSTPGCSVVLPTLAVCIADPGKPGCAAVLPTLTACIVNPSMAGCAVVLPTLAACTADPGKQGCSAVLPTLAACTAKPSMAGCTAVLPTLSTCAAVPATAGCSAILPTLAQCTASPTLQGCPVVLPPADVCANNPAAAGCVVVAPPTTINNEVVQQTLVTTINIINPGSPVERAVTPATGLPVPAPGSAKEEKKADKKDDKKDVAAADKPGAKNDDAAKKMYCN